MPSYLLEIGEGTGRERRELTIAPVLGRTGGLRRRAIDADPHELALGLGDVFGGLTEQGDRGPPRDQPTQVRGEGAVETEVQCAGCVAGGERGPVAQVDDPLTGLDALAELPWVGRRGRSEVRLRGASRVGGTHVGVVGRERAETVEELADVGLLVLGQHGVGLLLLPDRGLGRVGLGRGAERAEAVGGEHLCRVGQEVGQSVGRGVLVADQRVGVLLTEQVRPAGGAVQQRTTGEHTDRAVAACGGVRVGQGVGEVRKGVTRRRQRRQSHPVADSDSVAVTDWGAFEGNLVLSVDVVGRVGALGQGETTGDVVVVDVGLEDVG